MHCMKLLGQRLAARDFDRQVAEIQIRAAILNGFTALGIPRTVGRRLSPSGARGSTTALPFVQQSPLEVICARLNATPRKCLGWKTPAKVFKEKVLDQAA